MKRLFSIGLLLCFALLSFGQCPTTTSLSVPWQSSTHNPYAAPYQATPVRPASYDPVDCYWMGSGQNSYKITAPTGNSPFTYNWQIGSGTAGNGTSAIMTMYMKSSSNGLASSITTDLGTFGVNASAVTAPCANARQTPNSPSAILYWNADAAPGVSRTITFPANPYSDRSLTFVIMVTGFNVFKPGCATEQVAIDYSFTNPPPYTYPINITNMYTPWVEITIPPSTAPTFINAGAGAYNSASGFYLDCPYPTGLISGDLLLMAVVNKSGATTYNTPVGWTLYANHAKAKIYYKVSTGSEAGTINVQWSPSAGAYKNIARIFHFRNAGTAFTGYGTTGNATTASTTNLPFTGPGQLGISFITSTATGSIGVFTGSNLTWLEPVGEYSPPTDACTLGFNYTVAPNAIVCTPGSQPLVNAQTFNLILKP